MSERDGAVRRRPLGAPIDGETKVGEKTTSSLSVLRRVRKRREELLDAMSRRKTLDWLGDERDARRRLAARREALHRQDDVFASHAASRIDRQAR